MDIDGSPIPSDAAERAHPAARASQVLSWDGSVTAHNAVARSLHKLFLALRAAQQQQATTAVGGVSAGAGSGDVPVAVNPAELREALAALPNRLFQLGEWLGGV